MINILKGRKRLSPFLHFNRDVDLTLTNQDKNFHLDCVILCDDIKHIECDVGSRLQGLHFHLHVPEDAEIAIDERLKSNQVVEWFKGEWKMRSSFRNCS